MRKFIPKFDTLPPETDTNIYTKHNTYTNTYIYTYTIWKYSLTLNIQTRKRSKIKFIQNLTQLWENPTVVIVIITIVVVVQI